MKYHNSLDEEADIETSERYFQKEQTEYINALREVKRYRLENVTVVKPEPGTSGTSDGGAGSRTDSFSREDIPSLMNMPKVELQIFSGVPLHYHEFIQTFDHNL